MSRDAVMLSEVTSAERRSQFVVAVFDDPQTCDPHAAYETSSRHVVLNVYESLLGYDAQRRQLTPRLSTNLPSPARTARGFSYEFKIRSGVVTHAGTRLTTADVVYSVRRAIITATGPSSLWLEPLLGLRVTRATTGQLLSACKRIQGTNDSVVVTVRERFPAFLFLVAHWSLVIPRDWAAAAGEWDGDLNTIEKYAYRSRTRLFDRTNGTGPFMLERWDRSRRVLHFRRHTRHWAPSATVERVLLVSEDDAAARESALMHGSADLAVCEATSRDRLSKAPGFVVDNLMNEWHLNPLGCLTQHLAPNCKELGSGRFDEHGIPANALADRELRRALALCFDYEKFVESALDGHAELQCGVFPRPALPRGPFPQHRFDLDEARRALERAWRGAITRTGCFIIAYAHDTNRMRVRAAHILAEGFNALHPRCRMEVREIPLAQLLQLLYARRCPVAWLGWAADYLHPHALAAPLLAPEAQLPRALGIKSSEVRQLLQEAVSAASGRVAASAYRRIAAVAIREQLYLFTPARLGYLSYHSRWQNVRCKDGLANVLDFASVTRVQT